MTIVYFNPRRVNRFKSFFDKETYTELHCHSLGTDTPMASDFICGQNIFSQDILRLQGVVSITAYKGDNCVELDIWCDGEEHEEVVPVSPKDDIRDVVDKINDIYFNITGENIRVSQEDTSFSRYDLIFDNTKT